MSESGCSKNINDINKPDSNILPKDSIELVEGNNIKIIEQDLGNKKVYTIGYEPFSLPRVSWESSVGITKVGLTVPSVTFNANISEGSNTIVSRSMTPDKGLDLNLPFTWNETNVLGTAAGLWPQFSGSPTIVEVQDDEANNVVSSIGVEFRHLFYVGYSTEDSLTEAQVKGLVYQDLLTKIKDKYAMYTYNYTVVPAYLYWVFPADTEAFTAAEEGPLPVPIKLDLPNISITDEGVTKSYRVIRTAAKTKFVGAEIKLL